MDIVTWLISFSPLLLYHWLRGGTFICLASVELYSRKTNKANISLFPLSQGMYPPASRIYLRPRKKSIDLESGVSVDVDLSGTSWHSSAQTNFADLIPLPPAVDVLRLHFLPPAMIPSKYGGHGFLRMCSVNSKEPWRPSGRSTG